MIASAVAKKKESTDQTAARRESLTGLYVFPLDPFRLQSRAKPRDYASLSSVRRQIAAAHTRAFVLSTQTSSFEMLHPSRPLSPTEITRSGLLPSPHHNRSAVHSRIYRSSCDPCHMPHAQTSLNNRSVAYLSKQLRSWRIRSLRSQMRKSRPSRQC